MSESASNVAFRVAAALGLTGVALGAFGAHALKPTLAAFGTADIWQTGVHYHLVHAVALLALAAAGRATRTVTLLWLVGVIIFAGSLYVMGVTGLRWLGAITPIGGVCLIAGWIWLLVCGRAGSAGVPPATK